MFYSVRISEMRAHILAAGDAVMTKQEWKTTALWVLMAEAVGAFSGWLSREGMALYAAKIEKPPLSPPGAVFPVVWAVLYALMGFGASVIDRAPAGEARDRALRIYRVQLGVNFFWSLIFFNLQWYGFAFLWLAMLWALVFGMICRFAQVSVGAARLQWPYLVWLTFAAYLNLGVWVLN